MEANPTTKESFLAAYDLHADAIFRYCFFKVSNREQALDLSADTFTKAWEYIAKGGTVDNMKAFLYRIATNAIIDYRRKKKSTSFEALTDEGYDIANENEVDHEKISDQRIILKSLEKLDEKYRTVLTLRYIDDLTITEIAKTLGESENNISVIIHRGIDKLRNEFNSQSGIQ